MAHAEQGGKSSPTYPDWCLPRKGRQLALHYIHLAFHNVNQYTSRLLSVQGGGMRGVISGAMLMGLRALGLQDVFDAVYGESHQLNQLDHQGLTGLCDQHAHGVQEPTSSFVCLFS